MKNIDDRPIGAVENGAVFMDRIEMDYEFSCEAGVLNLCSDWIELRMCFEVMADYIRHKSYERAEATEAELAQIKAQVPYGYIDGPHFSTEPIEGWIPIFSSPVDQTAKIERLREALRFYADKSKWDSSGFEHGLSDDGGHNTLTLVMSDIDNDRGGIARVALSGKSPS